MRVDGVPTGRDTGLVRDPAEHFVGVKHAALRSTNDSATYVRCFGLRSLNLDFRSTHYPEAARFDALYAFLVVRHRLLERELVAREGGEMAPGTSDDALEVFFRRCFVQGVHDRAGPHRDAQELPVRPALAMRATPVVYSLHKTSTEE